MKKVLSPRGLIPFIPAFLKWTVLSLNLDLSSDVNRGLNVKSKTE